MGVAIVMLFRRRALASAGALQYVSVIAGAIAGAATVILLLLGLSSSLRSSATLLIAGIMLSYLASSVISLLNFFAPADGVKSFVVWGLGSFGGVTASELPLFCTVLAAALSHLHSSSNRSMHSFSAKDTLPIWAIPSSVCAACFFA